MRVVFDTNILFSAVLFEGIPRKILRLALEQEFIAITSPAILEELSESLRKKTTFSIAYIDRFKRRLSKIFKIVYPNEEINICRDKDDNRILEAAIMGDCDYLVSGDKDLLALKHYKKIQIISPREFLENIISEKFDK